MKVDLSLIIPIILIPILLLAYWRLRLKRLKTYHSPLLGKIEVFEKYNKEKVLTINTYVQGVSVEDSSIVKSYWYKIADLAVSHSQNLKDPESLMLGLGTNSISSLINKLDPRIHQTLVEFDSQIIQACKDYFGLNELTNFKLIHTDAYEWLKKSKTKSKYDTIIVDIFTGKPPYVDLKSNQPNFIQQVIPLLKKDGMLIFNRPGNTDKARSDSQKLNQYLQTKFKNTNLYDIQDPRGFRNNVITALDKI